jgi:predicted DNA-binding protein with PD1-like motif/glutaredoxin
MHTLPLHLDAGSDVRQCLESLARERRASGFVLSVVGNLSTAVFQCPGKAAPTRLRGELEIITLSGTLAPDGVHLHLSFSDGDCRVWGGHLEPGTLVLRGADLLLGFLPTGPSAATHPVPVAAGAPPARPAAATAAPDATASGSSAPHPSADPTAVRLEIAVLPGCPWSARALRMLRTLAIPHRVETVQSDQQRQALAQRSGLTSLPVVFLDGMVLGGYDALAERHGRGELDELRQP